MTGRYLVTGGCGFIGSHLADALAARGARVRILDDLSTGRAERCPPGAELQVGSVADPQAVAAAMEGVKGCFHLAAIASVQRCTNDWLGAHRVNLGGTIAVLDAARPHAAIAGGADAPGAAIPVVYASSSAVYGGSPAALLSEAERPAPLSAYGADKLGCELQAAVATGYGVPTLGFRFFNVYGPRQDGSSPYSGVISVFRDRTLAGQAVVVNGDGAQTRDFVHVSDVVRALLAGMDALQGRTGHDQGATLPPVLNVCTGVAVSILELAQGLVGLGGGQAGVAFGPARFGDVGRSCGDPTLLARVLGVRAQVRLADGLASLMA